MCNYNVEMIEYLFSNGHITEENVFTVRWHFGSVVTLGDAVVLGGYSDKAMLFVDIVGSNMVASLSKVSMFEAFRRLNAGALKRLIEAGLPLTIGEDINNTVLHVALDNRDASAVLEFILPLTPELYNETNTDNETVLGREITLPFMNALRPFIKVDGISPSSNGRRLSPLYIAASTQDVNTVLSLRIYDAGVIIDESRVLEHWLCYLSCSIDIRTC